MQYTITPPQSFLWLAVIGAMLGGGVGLALSCFANISDKSGEKKPLIRLWCVLPSMLIYSSLFVLQGRTVHTNYNDPHNLDHHFKKK